VYGINAPELTTEAGKAARAHLIGLLGWTPEARPQVVVTTIKDRTEKYGRILVTIILAGRDINAAMVADGHAVRYLP